MTLCDFYLVDAHDQTAGEAAALGFVSKHQGQLLAVLRVSGGDFGDPAPELL